MKKLLLLLLVLGTFSMARADDAADARQAFDTFVAYQKTDDPHVLDLFSPDCEVVFTLDDGKKTKEMPLPMATFRNAVTAALAKKQGNKDTYENVQSVKAGDLIKVSSTRLDADSGRRVPFLVAYGRDPSGQLKIKSLRVTLPVDQLPGGD